MPRICLAAAALALGAAFLVADVLAQQRVPQQLLKQFGPRTNKPAGTPGAAQQRAATLKDTSEVIAKHGDWTVTCDKTATKSADEKTRPCAMLQSAKHEKNEKVALTLILLKGQKEGKPNTMMRVIAPIGVFLPTGVALEIDGEAVGRVPFTRCLPQACIAFAEASPPTLEKMRKGGKANFIIYEAPGLGMSLELSLRGFTAGLKNLHEL